MREYNGETLKKHPLLKREELIPYFRPRYCLNENLFSQVTIKHM